MSDNGKNGTWPFPRPLPVVVATGEYESGKSLLILTTGAPLDRTPKVMGVHIALDFTGAVRNRPLEPIKDGSSITETEVCCSSSITRNFSIALVMFSLNFATA